MSSKAFGADLVESKASRHAAGEDVGPCETDTIGLIERDSSD
jgi:hypothetical protein